MQVPKERTLMKWQRTCSHVDDVSPGRAPATAAPTKPLGTSQLRRGAEARGAEASHARRGYFARMRFAKLRFWGGPSAGGTWGQDAGAPG